MGHPWNPWIAARIVAIVVESSAPFVAERQSYLSAGAGRVVSISGSSMFGGWVTATSESIDGAPPAPIVVERATHVDVDGVRRARQVSIAGNLTQP